MTPDRALVAFAEWCIAELRGDNIGSDINGGDAQDKLVELGILEWVEVTEPCGEQCACAVYDDFPQQCLRRSQVLDARLGGRAVQ